MNYIAHYEQLIARGRGRVLSGYVERHHVMPRSIGGSDDAGNIVALTPEEHYVAHQLLVKMLPRSPTLAHAAVMMSTRCTGNKAYGWLRRRAAQAASLVHKGRKRPPRSPEWCARISAAKKGKPINSFSPEHRAKLSLGAMRREARAGMQERRSAKAKANPLFMKQAVSDKPKYVASAEMRAKMSASQKARFARELQHGLGRYSE